MRRIDKNAQILNVADLASLDSTAKTLGASDNPAGQP
jgi:hypothetical protein